MIRYKIASSIVVATTCFFVSSACSQDSFDDDTVVSARTAISEYRNSVKKLKASFRAAQRKLSKKFDVEAENKLSELLTKLDSAKAAAMSAGELEEAIWIRDEIEQFKENKSETSNALTQNNPDVRKEARSKRLNKELKARIEELEKTVASQAGLLAEEPFRMVNVAPGFSVKNCELQNFMMLGEYNGNSDVLMTHPLNRTTPCELNKSITLSNSKRHKLLVRVSHKRGGDWRLIAKINGQIVYSQDIGDRTVFNGWRDVEIDLAKYAGRKINIQLLHVPTGWRNEHGYWDMIRVVSDD